MNYPWNNHLSLFVIHLWFCLLHCDQYVLLHFTGLLCGLRVSYFEYLLCFANIFTLNTSYLSRVSHTDYYMLYLKSVQFTNLSPWSCGYCFVLTFCSWGLVIVSCWFLLYLDHAFLGHYLPSLAVRICIVSLHGLFHHFTCPATECG